LFKLTPEYRICIRPTLSFVGKRKPWLIMNENKKKKRKMTMMIMMTKTYMLMKKMMAMSFTQKIGRARSSTYHHKYQRNSFHFRSDGQVWCVCPYNRDYIIGSRSTIILLHFFLRIFSFILSNAIETDQMFFFQDCILF
jgi:hypothetical protein